MHGVALNTADTMNAARAAPKPVNPSCFGNVEDVTGTCSSVASRVERVVARLCGQLPPSTDGAGQITGEPNGLFEAADRQARDIRSSMDRIIDAVTRLEGSLP